uniref:Uncharacterized protein n=1 Tax=Solibacter usitatus (strain Ellin6076) TaxID=234267 RepID=Q01ZY6_SOLUE
MLGLLRRNPLAAVVVFAMVDPPGSRGQDAKPVFEVASLKPAPPPQGRITVDLGNSSHRRLTLTNVTLSECLRFAFKIYTDDQIAGPNWIKDHRTLFNIVAQAPPDAPRDTLRQRALSLLTERFQLAVHHESRELDCACSSFDRRETPGNPWILSATQNAQGPSPDAQITRTKDDRREDLPPHTQGLSLA